jgi:3-hydroxyacyl-CoA dehydrogenase
MGLVIWQTEPPFSVGANLKKTQKKSAGTGRTPSMLGKLMKTVRRAAGSLALRAARHIGIADQLMAGRLAEVEHILGQFQQTTQALKFSIVPTVAAVDGLALGGGCEFVMHCDRAVATLESYIGLVEVGVGLLPGAGGCKEFAMRAAADAKGGDIGHFIQKYFRTVAMAEVARSAEHARELGYLRPTDTIVMNRYELLHVAKAQLRALAESGYRPPLPQIAIPVAGRNAIGTIKAHMVNMREGGHISEHDYLVGSKVAEVMCGGYVEGGSLVDEQWFLRLEREAFMQLIATENTQARIDHMLKTGKPLRN